MPSNDATAILFPGQGVGDDSSRQLVERVRPDLLELATDLVGADPFERIGESTRFAQPAVYCASIAGFELLGSPEGDFRAGHSLGEVAALAAGGAFDADAGLRIVVSRGRAMDDAARAGEPGGMLAVGSDRLSAERLAADHRLVVANENSPQQFVLSGPEEAIKRAEAAAKSGGVRAKRLAIAGAFHTEAMESAIEPFGAALEKVEIREARVPVLSSSTTRFFGGPAEIREALASSLTGTIRWTSVLWRLRELGARTFLDVGPGKVLAGLVRRTIDDAEVETLASLEGARA